MKLEKDIILFEYPCFGIALAHTWINMDRQPDNKIVILGLHYENWWAELTIFNFKIIIKYNRGNL